MRKRNGVSSSDTIDTSIHQSINQIKLQLNAYSSPDDMVNKPSVYESLAKLPLMLEDSH